MFTVKMSDVAADFSRETVASRPNAFCHGLHAARLAWCRNRLLLIIKYNVNACLSSFSLADWSDLGSIVYCQDIHSFGLRICQTLPAWEPGYTYCLRHSAP